MMMKLFCWPKKFLKKSKKKSNIQVKLKCMLFARFVQCIMHAKIFP